MRTLEELKTRAIEIMKEDPSIAEEIQDLYFLAVSESEEEGRVEEEVEKAVQDMEDALADAKKETTNDTN